MSSYTFARATAFSLSRTKLFLGTVCAALLATATAEAKPYKGAEVDSMKTYLYGRFEIRMRMITGSGLVSSFFTYKNGSELGNGPWGEIDIEAFGKDTKFWQTNIITGNPKSNDVEIEHVETPLGDDYHTYTVEWTPDYIYWALDGTEVRKAEGNTVPDLKDAMSLRFNAWSCEIEGWAGPFDDAVLPAYQFVNWIKYYRYENGKFILDWVDDFDTFDETRWSRASWSFDQNRVDFTPANALVKDGTLILAITKEGAEGFTGTVPVDPKGNAGPGPTPSGGAGGNSGSGSGGAGGNSGSGSGGTSGSSSSSSSGSSKPADASGCSLAPSADNGHAGWLSMLLLGLAVLGLRTKRSRKN